MDNWIPNYFEYPTMDIDICYLDSYIPNKY